MKKKILICDDDTGILEMLSLFLDYSGFDIVTQAHSIHVFKDIDSFKPDLLIVDLWMPGLNGEQIIRRLKDDEIWKHLPIILTSAGQDGERIAYEVSADKFIAKPFDIEKLLAVANDLIGQASSLQSLPVH